MLAGKRTFFGGHIRLFSPKKICSEIEMNTEILPLLYRQVSHPSHFTYEASSGRLSIVEK
jgi:hypothetical protein